MRESLGVEALTDPITTEPPSWLAKSRLNVRRRERSQRIGHYIDVSRCSHGHLPRSNNVTPRKARSRITGSVARACSPPTVAPGDSGRKRKSRRALGGDTTGQNSVDDQWNDRPRIDPFRANCVGRSGSCQGRGRGFESLRPLQFSSNKSASQNGPSGSFSASPPLTRRPGKQGGSRLR